MTPDAFLRCAIAPGLSLLPPAFDSPEARAMILTIALQESDLLHRKQIRGPARSYLMFEIIGLTEVLRHPTSSGYAAMVVNAIDYADAPPVELHHAIEHNDLLACCLARLALWRHPGPLPARAGAQVAWQYYLDIWAPGKPRPGPWPGHYARAWESVSG